MNQKLYDEFKNIIDDEKSSEQDCQDFLENHPDFIILDHLLNHHLHDNSIISKLPLDTSLTTDLVYLTKSSNKWHIVLVELEKPQIKLFKDDKKQVTPTSEFTKALSQIDTWRDYLRMNRDSFIKKLDPIRVPLSENGYDFKYVLILGRDEQVSVNKSMRERLKTYENNDLIIHTYDSLLRHYKTKGDSKYPSNILRLTKDKFTYKHLHSEPHTFFVYTKSEYCILEKGHKEQLEQWGYDIDEWEKGKPLSDGGKKVLKLTTKSN